MARPVKEFDKKLFSDLVALGCKEDEICWVFRDKEGHVANKDTLSRWCKREYGINFQEYAKQNEAMGVKTKLRQYQLELARKSAAMAIFLGKNYLGQKDVVVQTDDASLNEARKILDDVKSVIE